MDIHFCDKKAGYENILTAKDVFGLAGWVNVE